MASDVLVRSKHRHHCLPVLLLLSFCLIPHGLGRCMLLLLLSAKSPDIVRYSRSSKSAHRSTISTSSSIMSDADTQGEALITRPPRPPHLSLFSQGGDIPGWIHCNSSSIFLASQNLPRPRLFRDVILSLLLLFQYVCSKNYPTIW